MTRFDVGKLLGLRPKGDGAAELRAARDAALAAGASAGAKAAELEARRGEVLLEGRPDAVAAHEAALAEARTEAERAAAMAAALGPRVAAAQAREGLAELRRLRAEARERQAAVERWLRTEYPRLAEQLAGGFGREREAAALAAKAEAAAHRLAASGAELAAEDLAPIEGAAQRFWPGWVGAIGDAVQLPSTEGPPRPFSSAAPVWPPAVVLP